MDKYYLEKGERVEILIKWGTTKNGMGGGPKNVMIQRADGTKVVRPFRGLRKIRDENSIYFGATYEQS